ncbi:MAG: redoxin family protein [Actinomycetia bacterium]|nr:redoxin family protein [Actinomycetes bacterium]
MTPRTRLLVPAVVLALSAVACGSSDSSDVSGSADGAADSSETETETERAAEPLASGIIEVTGDPLPELADGGDPTVGSPSPMATSVNFDGEPTAIADDGRAKAIVFVAHWCPHCQDEVPVLVDWLDAGNKPDSVDFITVVTAMDPNASNYPPSEWLSDEGLDTPMLLDDEDDTLATAFGLSAFPFWVVVDGDGMVVVRTSGGLGTDGFEDLARAALAGAEA